MAFSATEILNKMNNRDQDFRMIAFTDLSKELVKDDFKLDKTNEGKIVTKTLELLQDPSKPVREHAVSCLPALFKKLQNIENVLQICKFVGKLLVADPERKGQVEDFSDLRDRASSSIKKVVLACPEEPKNIASTLVSEITPIVLKSINMNAGKHETHQNTIAYGLDNANDLLSRFGSGTLMNTFHKDLLGAIIPHLKSARKSTRSAAVQALASLSVGINNQLFTKLVKDTLISTLSGSSNTDQLRTDIQLVAAISKLAGYRLAPYMKELCPIVVKQTSVEDDEVREACFQCMESFIIRCPRETKTYIDSFVDTACKLTDYDPLYPDEDEEWDDDQYDDDEDYEPEEEEDADDEEDDEEDQSWKVRRGAVKVLGIVVETHSELLGLVWEKVGPALIRRFKERQHTVQSEVMAAFRSVLEQTAIVHHRNPNDKGMQTLKAKVGKICYYLVPQLKKNNVHKRVSTFQTLAALSKTLNGGLERQTNKISDGFKFSLAQKKISADAVKWCLQAMATVLSLHKPEVFQPQMGTLTPLVVKAAEDRNYRTSTAGLFALAGVVNAIRPTPESTFEWQPFADPIFKVASSKLTEPKLDAEQRAGAIVACSATITNLGDKTGNVESVFEEIVKRIDSETVRMEAIRGVASIAGSPLKLKLGALGAKAVSTLSKYLSQSYRPLKIAVFDALAKVVDNTASDPAVEKQLPQLFSELAKTSINDKDLGIATIGFEIVNAAAVQNKNLATKIIETIIPAATELLKSQLHIDATLVPLESLFTTLVKQGHFKALESVLLKQNPATSSHQRHVAAAIGALSASDPQSEGVTSIVKNAAAKVSKGDDFSLYLIGDIGRRRDLSEFSGLYKSVLQSLESGSQDTQRAGSFCLGSIAVGSLDKIMPEFLADISKNPKIAYLMVQSLREVIVRQSETESGISLIKNMQKDVAPLLFQNCEHEDEATRSAVSECLGKIALISPDIIAQLVSTASSSVKTGQTIVGALKFLVSSKQVQPSDVVLQESAEKFLALSANKDVETRRQLAIFVSLCVKNKPNIIREILPKYVSFIYEEATPRKDMCEEIDLGNFKVYKDAHLETRQTIFNALELLADLMLDHLDPAPLALAISQGVTERDWDLKIQTHRILVSLMHDAPLAFSDIADKIIEGVQASLTTKVSTDDAVKQEDNRKNILKTVYTLSKLPNVDTQKGFTSLIEWINKGADEKDDTRKAIAKEYAAIIKEKEGEALN